MYYFHGFATAVEHIYLTKHLSCTHECLWHHVILESILDNSVFRILLFFICSINSHILLFYCLNMSHPCHLCFKQTLFYMAVFNAPSFVNVINIVIGRIKKRTLFTTFMYISPCKFGNISEPLFSKFFLFDIHPKNVSWGHIYLTEY